MNSTVDARPSFPHMTGFVRMNIFNHFGAFFLLSPAGLRVPSILPDDPAAPSDGGTITCPDPGAIRVSVKIDKFLLQIIYRVSQVVRSVAT